MGYGLPQTNISFAMHRRGNWEGGMVSLHYCSCSEQLLICLLLLHSVTAIYYVTEVAVLLTSFPDSCMWANKKEPGLHTCHEYPSLRDETSKLLA